MALIIRRPGAAQTVPKGDNGWSQFPAPTVGTVYYVSDSAGNDGNTGLSEAQAWQTLLHAESVMVNLRDDHLLLKRGDDWTGESFPTWTKSGLDAGHPMLISTYGTSTARPIVGGTTHGWNSGNAITNFAMVGVDLHPSTVPGGADWCGMRTLHDSVNLLFEDCIFRDYGGNIVLQTGWPQEPHNITNVRFRRCMILHAADGFGGNNHSEGAYCRGVNGLLFEDCVIDHNGWDLTLSPPMPRNIFSHGLYITNENTDVTVKGCWLSNNSSDGHQLRCGGRLRNNIYMGNRLGCHVGSGGDNGYVKPGGVTLDLDNCLILNGNEIGVGAGGGWGFRCGNIASGTVDDLVIAGPNATSLPVAMEFVGTRYTGNYLGETFPSVGTTNLACTRVYVSGWGGNVHVGEPNIVNVSISDSSIPDLHYTSVAVETYTPVILTDCEGEGTVSLNLAFYENLLAIAKVRPVGVWGPIYETTTIIDYARDELGIDGQEEAALASLSHQIEPHAIGGAGRIDFDVQFSWTDVPANTTAQPPTGPVERAAFLVPAGHIAHLTMMQLESSRLGIDITQATGALYVGPVGPGDIANTDVSAAWETLSVQPSSYNKWDSARPLHAMTYVVDATLEDYTFHIRLSTNGTAGTMDAAAHVLGHLVRA